jgi:hypothetical protein
MHQPDVDFKSIILRHSRKNKFLLTEILRGFVERMADKL